MKDEEVENESEEIVKEEQEPEASVALPDALLEALADAIPDALPDATTSEEVGIEEKPVLAELEPEPMETDTPKEGEYQILTFIFFNMEIWEGGGREEIILQKVTRLAINYMARHFNQAGQIGLVLGNSVVRNKG